MVPEEISIAEKIIKLFSNENIALNKKSNNTNLYISKLRKKKQQMK